MSHDLGDYDKIACVSVLQFMWRHLFNQKQSISLGKIVLWKCSLNLRSSRIK